ncbi:C45 family autoproteolytic acyltransferase/hydrolase [SAR92 clade bacterium H246]
MNTCQMPVIELRGTPRERGRQHGEMLKPQVQGAVNSWLQDLGSFGRNSTTSKPLESKQYLENLFSETNYLKAISHWAPDLLDEVRGIAEGSGQPFEYILGLNLMDEEWIFGRIRNMDRPTDKCTAFAIPGGIEGSGFAGQNMDISSWADGKQSLLRIGGHNNAPESLMFTIAGCIGLNGLNASGLGVTCNTLSQLQHAVDGLPVLFIIRKLLEKSNIDEAEQFLRSVRHASGQNYILSTGSEMRCFECCGKSVIRYEPAHLKGRVFHTNHPLINSDISNIPALNRSSESTFARLNSITQRLGDVSRVIAIDDIKAALSAQDDPDNPVSCDINLGGSSIGFTAGSSIYEFSEPPRLHLAAGPPNKTEFKTYEFNLNK